MSRKMISILALVLITAVTFSTFTQAAPSESAADFYKDHTVTLIINSNPGGNSDYMGRLVASYWTDTVGGPMIVKNDAGGNGLVGVNKVYSAKPDGLTIGVAELVPKIVQPYILQLAGVKFDPRKLNYLVRAGANPYIFVAASNLQDVKTVSDLKNKKNLRFAVGGAAGGDALGSSLVLDFWGLDGKIVAGLKAAEVGMAMARKEAHGAVCSSAMGGEFIDSGFVKAPPLAIFTKAKSEWYKDTPTVRELIGSQLNAGQKGLLSYMEGIPGDKAFFTGPDVPKDRVLFMQDAMAKVMRDKNFVKLISQMWKVWTGIEHGKETPAFVEEAMAIPKDTLESIDKILGKYVIR